MAEYLVELYVAHGDHAAARHQAECAEIASADLTGEGRPVRCLQSIFVPEDETCLLLFEASSADLVVDTVRRAGLRHEHISAATSPSAHHSVSAVSAADDVHSKGITP